MRIQFHFITYLNIGILILLMSFCSAQTTIQMRKEGGVYSVPCSVNGLKLRFIFDTGASDVSISMTEALFMLKNDYLDTKDIIGKQYYSDATGLISEGTKIILRRVEFNGIILKDIEASVVHELAAPLLLGQTVMSKLGTFQFDPNAGTVTILNVSNKSQSISNTSQAENISQQTTNSDIQNSNINSQYTINNDNAEKNTPKNTYNKYNYRREFPCLSISAPIIYTTKISLGTFLLDDTGINGKSIKKLITNQNIDVINDSKFGDYVFARFNSCYGYVLKIGLEKFNPK